MISRTLTFGQHLDLSFNPTKADGSPAAVDLTDHKPDWTVDDGTTAHALTPGTPDEFGGLKWAMSGDQLACRVDTVNPAGGTGTYVVTVSGDADLDDGEVRNVVAVETLEISVLPDEAIQAGLGVSDPIDPPAAP